MCRPHLLNQILGSANRMRRMCEEFLILSFSISMRRKTSQLPAGTSFTILIKPRELLGENQNLSAPRQLKIIKETHILEKWSNNE